MSPAVTVTVMLGHLHGSIFFHKIAKSEAKIFIPRLINSHGQFSVETYLCGDRLHGLNQTDGQLDGTGGVQSHLAIVIEILHKE